MPFTPITWQDFEESCPEKGVSTKQAAPKSNRKCIVLPATSRVALGSIPLMMMSDQGAGHRRGPFQLKPYWIAVWLRGLLAFGTVPFPVAELTAEGTGCVGLFPHWPMGAVCLPVAWLPAAMVVTWEGVLRATWRGRGACKTASSWTCLLCLRFSFSLALSSLFYSQL